MKKASPATLVAILSLAIPMVASGQAPSAEHFFRPGSVALSIYGGGGAFSTLHRVEGAEGAPVEIAAQTSSAFAGEVVWWLSPSFGLRMHGSLVPSRFGQHQVRDEPSLAVSAGPDSTAAAGVNVWIADVSALIRPPFTLGRLAPYAVLGAGLVSYRPRGDGALPPGVADAFSRGSHTAAAGVIGLGAAVPLQRERLLLSFALTNHLTRPLAEGEEGISTTSHVRLLAGLTVPLRIGN